MDGLAVSQDLSSLVKDLKPISPLWVYRDSDC
jgi:hypothetical protein